MSSETKKPIFKILSMKGVSEKAKKVKPSVDKKRKNTTRKSKLTPLEFKYKDITPIHEFYTKDGSVQDFLNECHPDVKDFIDTNKPVKYTAEAGRLIVTTANKFRIEVKITGKHTRQVTIKDNRRETIYNGESIAILPKSTPKPKFA